MKNPFFKKPRNEYDSYDAYDSGFYRGDEEEEGVVGDDLEDEAAPLPPKKPVSPAKSLYICEGQYTRR